MNEAAPLLEYDALPPKGRVRFARTAQRTRLTITRPSRKERLKPVLVILVFMGAAGAIRPAMLVAGVGGPDTMKGALLSWLGALALGLIFAPFLYFAMGEWIDCVVTAESFRLRFGTLRGRTQRWKLSEISGVTLVRVIDPRMSKRFRLQLQIGAAGEVIGLFLTIDERSAAWLTGAILREVESWRAAGVAHHCGECHEDPHPGPLPEYRARG